MTLRYIRATGFRDTVSDVSLCSTLRFHAEHCGIHVSLPPISFLPVSTVVYSAAYFSYGVSEHVHGVHWLYRNGLAR